MTDLSQDAAKPIELFAQSCEALNSFARELREQGRYGEVRTSADIRTYSTGWRLEKYVEAEIDLDEGYVAAWCLELSRKDGNWLVASSVNVSNTDVYFDLGTRAAESVEQLESILRLVTTALAATAASESSFSNAIRAISDKSV